MCPRRGDWVPDSVKSNCGRFHQTLPLQGPRTGLIPRNNLSQTVKVNPPSGVRVVPEMYLASSENGALFLAAPLLPIFSLLCELSVRRSYCGFGQFHSGSLTNACCWLAFGQSARYSSSRCDTTCRNLRVPLVLKNLFITRRESVQSEPWSCLRQSHSRGCSTAATPPVGPGT